MVGTGGRGGGVTYNIITFLTNAVFSGIVGQGEFYSMYPVLPPTTPAPDDVRSRDVSLDGDGCY